MSDTHIPDTQGAGSSVHLDPFAFWPASASRIAGLGGETVDPDPAYVFHTVYTALPTGSVRCTARFTDLAADCGSMIVRINALPLTANSRAQTVKTWTVQLRDVADAGGEISAAFDADPDTSYAVLGHIYTETDATAHGLTIVLEASSAEKPYETKLAASRKSIFGRKMFRRANRMITEGKATLFDPVSQACTAAQFDEPVYAEWLDRMKAPLHRHRKQWEFVYILQALRRYGMLKSGARGLGFGVGLEPLPAVMATYGCSVLATDLASDDARARDWTATNQHLDSRESLRHPEICPDEVFDRLVTTREIDMNMIGSDLVDFDFTWSACSLEHLGSIAAGADFIRNSIGCLKHGGLAVHTTEFNLTSNTDTVDNDGTVLFRKQDIEKIALDLVSRGHFVAQIKYDFGDTPLDTHVDVPPYSDSNHLKLAIGRYVTTSIGIIVRRGDR